MNLDGIDIFVRVVQAGSFTAAAKQLNMPVTTISGKVAQLEKRLGVTLIQRTTRKMNITDAGERFYNRCKIALEEIFAGQEELETGKKEPEGTLKITAAVDVGHSLLPPIIQSYMKAYPKMKVELAITNRMVDLLSENIDIALRIGTLKDSTFIARKFIETNGSLWASSAFVKKYGAPKDVKELKKLPHINFAGNGDKLQLNHLTKKISTTIETNARLTSDDMETIKHLILLGEGIGICPDFLCQSEEKSGKMIRVLPEWSWNTIEIHFVFPAQKYVPPKIHSFIDFALKSVNKN